MTGTIIVSIGISCFNIAAYNLAGGQGDPSMGQLHNWLIGALVIVVIVACSAFGKGMVSAAAVLIGIVAGYVVAAVTGYVDFSSIAAAKWFDIPRPRPSATAVPLSSSSLSSSWSLSCSTSSTPWRWWAT